MNNQYQEELNILINLIKNDSRIKELKKLRMELVNDSTLISKINQIQTTDNLYDSSIIKLKKELFDNELYSRYVSLENEIYFLTLEINQILNRLTDRKGCSRWKL